MNAVFCTRYGPPEVLEIREISTPVPKDDEVLVKVHAATVAAADFRIRSFTIPPPFGLPARLILGIHGPRNPILGVELSGEVVSSGKKVTRFKTGDLIFGSTLARFGAYAEYTCLPENGPIAIKPPRISHAQAAALPIGAGTALHYLRKAGIRKGDKILIYGASGSVGTYAVQLAAYFGAEVTGVCSKANLDLVTSLGASKVLDYAAPDFRQQLETYDIILEAVDKLPFSIATHALTKEGIYMNVTAPVKSFERMWASMTTRKKIFIGENVPEKAEDMAYLGKLAEDGIMKPVIDRTYPLSEIVDAHRYVDKGHKKGNVVISVVNPA